MRVRHPLLWYFGLAFGISWTGVLLSQAQHNPIMWFVAMLLGPATASLLLTALFDDTRGLRELAQRLLHVRVGRWYAMALVAPLILIAVLAVLSASSPDYTPRLFTTTTPGTLVVFALLAGAGAGAFEELGWTGFATPRLLRRYAWFDAGLIIGVPWAIWHMLPDYLGHADHGALWFAHALQWLVALTAFRAFMTWVYSRTHSLALAMLLHATFTGSQVLLWPVGTTPETELVWYGVFGCGLWLAIGFGLLVAHRMTSTGPSARERVLPLLGDMLVPDPLFTVTRAIDVDAPADDVFADIAIAEPVPGAGGAYVVSMDAPNDLVVAIPDARGNPVISWEHHVETLDGGGSRVVVRERVGRSWPRYLPGTLAAPLARVHHRWLESRHLRDIKRRVEAI